MSKHVFLGLGSNLGDREANLRCALAELESPKLHLLRTSSIYETEPIGFLDQGWFFNLVAEFETDLFPKQLLARLQRVERSMGRQRTIKDGPRIIDIDILLYGSSIVRSPELEIPHPRYRDRRFTLAPLAELAPTMKDPVTGRTMTELLATLKGQTARRKAPSDGGSDERQR